MTARLAYYVYMRATPDWVHENCRFAAWWWPTASMPIPPELQSLDFDDLVDQAWDYFSQEEQYQIDRHDAHGSPIDQWLLRDQNILIEADEAEDRDTVARLFLKYKRLDEEGRRKAVLPQGGRSGV